MPKFAITLSRTIARTSRIIIKAADAASAFDLISELDLDDLALDWRDQLVGPTDLFGPISVKSDAKITANVQRAVDDVEAKWAALEKKEKEKNERLARRNRTRVRRRQ